MIDSEANFSNQDLLQVNHRLPVDVAADAIQDSWGSVMESHGIMNERTDYTPDKLDGDGYYTLKTNNADNVNAAASFPEKPVQPLE